MAKSSAVNQIKTTMGFVPFKAADLETKGSPSYRNHKLVYTLYSANELVNFDQPQAPDHDERHANLIGLASCVDVSGRENSGPAPDESAILDLARNTGPLFGQSSTEAIRDWGNAAFVALFAIRAQQSLNANGNIGVLSLFLKAGSLTKERFEREEDGLHLFDQYQFNFSPSGEYLELFKGLPIARILRRPSGFYYAFATLEEAEGGIPAILINVFRFEHELTSSDFRVLQSLECLDEELVECAQDNLRLSDDAENNNGVLDPNAVIDTTLAETLDPDEDHDALTALVQTLAVAHLSTAHVDVFQGSAETGFLAFDSYLSWLWFDFANKLSTVKIGYCLKCGKPFSLAGHRGLPRHYCGEQCKNAYKNEQARKAVNTIRRDFLDNGKSVNEIAEELHEKGESKKKALSKTREVLQSWPELKRKIEEEIREKGFENAKLLARCQREGLEVEKLLNTKRIKELKARAYK